MANRRASALAPRDDDGGLRILALLTDDDLSGRQGLTEDRTQALLEEYWSRTRGHRDTDGRHVPRTPAQIEDSCRLGLSASSTAARWSARCVKTTSPASSRPGWVRSLRAPVGGTRCGTYPYCASKDVRSRRVNPLRRRRGSFTSQTIVSMRPSLNSLDAPWNT